MVTENNIQTKVIKLHYLFPPIYLGIDIHDVTNQSCDLLTQAQIDYFKTKGNNAVVFIHGYNVSPGQFGKDQISTETAGLGGESQHGDPNQRSTLLINSYGCDCTYLRLFQDIKNKIPQDLCQYLNNINYQICKTENDRDVAIDAGINGTEAHNWLLHMEYNLNCAAVGFYPFPWTERALDYTRIITVYWPGDVFAPDFWQAQRNAVRSGTALVQLLQQLHSAGLSLNIIAHSLGALVTLQALELLASQNQYNIIDNLFLWQAAVANIALSPTKLPQSEQIPNAYFPHAHLAAKNTIVLSSLYDGVLEILYHLQDDVGYLIHPDFRYPPMGRTGPDNHTRLVLGSRLISVDQKNWLQGHSDMRIPSTVLFQNIYQNIVFKHLSHFGKYK